MENKIPNAEEILFDECTSTSTEWINKYPFLKEHILDAMKEFAKLHVQEALKQIQENVTTDCHCVEGYCNGIDKNSILNSYPEKNIK